jgi:hypothetical protein
VHAVQLIFVPLVPSDGHAVVLPAAASVSGILLIGVFDGGQFIYFQF